MCAPYPVNVQTNVTSLTVLHKHNLAVIISSVLKIQLVTDRDCILHNNTQNATNPYGLNFNEGAIVNVTDFIVNK